MQWLFAAGIRSADRSLHRVGLSRLIRSMKMSPGSPWAQADPTIRSNISGPTLFVTGLPSDRIDQIRKSFPSPGRPPMIFVGDGHRDVEILGGDLAVLFHQR